MKKYVIAIMPMILTACMSEPVQQSSVPMDMKTVQEYQQRVATGKTVSPTAKEDEQQLNQSNRAYKVKVYQYYPRVMAYPSFYYGGYTRFGVGLGYY